MKNTLTILLVLTVTWQCCVAPPVTKNKSSEEKEGEAGPENLELLMHYHRYLKEVVGALESDPDFKKKLEGADEADIRSGKIANQLEFVSHHVRTRLDEIKRYELERLRHLMKQKQHLTGNEVIDDPTHGHLDHANPHTFEIEDLKKLIAKTTEDLAEADRKRRDEFKEYELQKEFEKQEKLNHTNGDERNKLEKQFQEMDEKHKKHKPLHQPGHKAQLEEVWEEQDHMQQEFDPKTFFMLHDLDSNGLWDQDEVKALFIKELDKMYAAGAPEDDMRERVEEMERMRETVFQEVDLNKDGFIDFHEFLAQTQRQNFQQDNGWKGIDEQRPYTDEELEAYIRQQQMMHHPPPPGYHMPPGPYPPGQVHPAAYHPNQGAYQGHPNQVPQGGYQMHPNQVPQGGYQGHPNQAGYQVHPNQAAYQGHPNQVPQGSYQAQHPNQGYQQPPQYQAQQGIHQGNPPLNQNEVYPNQPNQGQPQQGQVLTGGHQPQAPPQNPNQGQQSNQPQQLNQGQQPNQPQLNQPQQLNQGQQPNQPQLNQPQQPSQGQQPNQPQQLNQAQQPNQPQQPVQQNYQANNAQQNQQQNYQVNQGQPKYQNQPKDQGVPQVQKL